MKVFNKTLQFLNRQIVRLNWGYAKFYVFIILINAISNLVTALTITQIFELKLIHLILIYLGTITVSIVIIYILSKMNILHDETKQIFDERASSLYIKQIHYQSVLIALYMRKSQNELNQDLNNIEKKLFGVNKNEKK